MGGELLRVAWKGIAANKLRSVLTVLGVVIGVAAVTALVSVGQGATYQVSQRMQNLGSNLILVTPLRGTELTLDDATDVGRRVPTVTVAVPVMEGQLRVKWGSQSGEIRVQAATAAIQQVRDLRVTRGRFFTSADVAARRPVAVAGATALDDLSSGGPPPRPGDILWIQGEPYTLIGILEAKGAAFGQSPDDLLYVPITAARTLLGAGQVSALYLQARSPEDAPVATDHVLRILRLRHPRADGQDPVRVFSQDQILDTIQQTTATLTLMLGAIAGISLVVGGIGIMNIMLVSVSERTREIGIRKAIGARRRDILVQFLAEAVVLSVLGGLLGLAAGAAGSAGIARLAGWPPQADLRAAAAGFGFAVLVGLFFGVYPAYQASRLDPIVALRSE